MIVSELIALLRTFDPSLPVCYGKYSEQVMIRAEEIEVRKLCIARDDGWVHDARPDKESIDYLVFPGN